jgi:hypothetical protein
MLDVDAANLHGLEGVRVLHQSARGFVRIGEGSVGGVFHGRLATSFARSTTHAPQPHPAANAASETARNQARPAARRLRVQARHPIRLFFLRISYPGNFLDVSNGCAAARGFIKFLGTYCSKYNKLRYDYAPDI